MGFASLYYGKKMGEIFFLKTPVDTLKSVIISS